MKVLIVILTVWFIIE